MPVTVTARVVQPAAGALRGDSILRRSSSSSIRECVLSWGVRTQPGLSHPPWSRYVGTASRADEHWLLWVLIKGVSGLLHILWRHFQSHLYICCKLPARSVAHRYIVGALTHKVHFGAIAPNFVCLQMHGT